MDYKFIDLLEALIKNQIEFETKFALGKLYFVIRGHKINKNGHRSYIQISEGLDDVGWFISKDGICELDVPLSVVVEYCKEVWES